LGDMSVDHLLKIKANNIEMQTIGLEFYIVLDACTAVAANIKYYDSNI
jgi:hypothetical protein